VEKLAISKCKEGAVNMSVNRSAETVNPDLSRLLADGPRDCWVALNSAQSEIVGRGSTPREAVAEAEQKGIPEPVLLWLPAKLVASVY
jgi:hypothetical protein